MVETPEREMELLLNCLSRLPIHTTEQELLEADEVRDLLSKNEVEGEEPPFLVEEEDPYGSVTPREILEQIDRIYGQEEAKHRAATVLYNHIHCKCSAYEAQNEEERKVNYRYK